MKRFLARPICVTALAILVAGAAALPAEGRMRVVPINDHLCKVVNGGKFVDIPGFPGEKIDRRLRKDIRWMRRKYDIFITDGYATSGHAWNGEHPIGLALDIVPNFSDGGSWNKIDNLAERFEPAQNRVRPPMRWVGYNGDAGHGRGHHLHLSYMHSDTEPKKPAKVVYTRVCPRDPDAGGDEEPQGSGDGDGGGSGSGGVSARKRGGGGLTAAEWANLAPVVPETHEDHDH